MINISQYKNPKPHEKFKCAQSEFIGESLRRAPAQFHRHIEKRFNWTAKKHGLVSANLELLKVSTNLKNAGIKVAQDDDEICAKAERFARECGRYIAAGGISAGRVYAKSKDIKLPECKTEVGEIARISDEQWWRRKLRVKHGRAVEREAIRLNMVHANHEIYASNASVSRRKSQNTRNIRTLQAVYAINELGEEFTLAKLAELSVSNPAIRRGELMTRIAGFEQYARLKQHVGEFLTVTCPSRMHCMTYKRVNGKAIVRVNKKYDGTTPRKAQQHLSTVWERTRAKFKREGIALYGFRVAEPQHDGTPHWHLLLFFPPEQVERAREIFKHYALQVDGDEKGADEHRFDAKAIDWTKGTATGYIAKYIAKNIDAYGVEDDLYGKDANKSVARVDAWASTWGIRQFQQIGGHSVTVWRELRRLSEEETKGLHIDKHRHAADIGDWFAYLCEMDKRKITLVKCWNDKPGRYVEPVGEQIIGIEYGLTELITRKHQWSIENGRAKRKQPVCECGGGNASGSLLYDENNSARGHYPGQEKSYSVASIKMPERIGSVGVRGNDAGLSVLSGVSSPPWSSVNNCTRSNASEHKNNNLNQSGSPPLE